MGNSYDMIERNILGGACIVFSTVVARFVDHQYLSPALFAMGIVLVIVLDLGLVTRAVPSGEDVAHCVSALAVNILTAWVLGLMYLGVPEFAVEFGHPSEYFLPAVATGIIIGLVSVVNKHKSEYTVPMTFMLMWTFVYLGLPHCVVYAVYLAANCMVDSTGAMVLLSVIAGNIAGGLIVRSADKLIQSERAGR